jgi:hypothetical protein
MRETSYPLVQHSFPLALLDWEVKSDGERLKISGEIVSGRQEEIFESPEFGMPQGISQDKVETNHGLQVPGRRRSVGVVWAGLERKGHAALPWPDLACPRVWAACPSFSLGRRAGLMRAGGSGPSGLAR